MIQEATPRVHDGLAWWPSTNPLYGEWKHGHHIHRDQTKKREPFEIDGYTYFCSYNERSNGRQGEGSITIVDEKVKFLIIISVFICKVINAELSYLNKSK